MSHVDPGPLASYNSLSDPNLTAYFNNSRMRKHLIKTGLVTRRGEIVSEKVFRLNNARKEHQRHVRDLLAQAIVHKALDMERHRQMHIKKQLEEIGKVERVRRVRADRALRGDEDILPLLSAPSQKSRSKQERPHTAPPSRSMGQPSSSQRQQQLPQSVGYPAIPGDSPYNTRSTRINTPYPNVEIDNQHLSQLDQEALRTFTLNLPNYDLGSGVSPYVVPVLDPASREAIETIKPTKRRRRKLKKRPATAPASTKKEKESNLSPRSNKHSLELHRREPPMIYKKQPRSLCLITFKYLGQMVHLDRETEDPRDEIMVDQQHCGGGNLCVYRGKLLPGNNFTIISQRHRGYPFSLTFYLNGIIVERLSACCEYKHKKGKKLGGKTSHFGFVKIEGVHPCYKCLVKTENFRTTSDQSALSKNTFRRHGDKDLEDDSRSAKKAVKKIDAKPAYEDSFASTDSEESSSDSSSISSLSTAEDDKLSHESSSSSSHADRKQVPGSPKRASSPKSSSQKSSKNSSSLSTLSDITSEDNKKPSSPRNKAAALSKRSSFSSASKSSEDEEEKIVYPEPVPLSKLQDHIKSLSTDKKIDLSHFALSYSQVDELREIITDNSPSIVTVVLCNCDLDAERLTDILEALTSFCTNIKVLNIGRNISIPTDAVLDLVKKSQLETLILDDNHLSRNDIKEVMGGLAPDLVVKSRSSSRASSAKPGKVISLGGSRPSSGARPFSSGAFNQLTVLDRADSPTSSEEKESCLQVLSLNRTGLDKEGVAAIAGFLALNPPLIELHLGGNNLSGEAVKPLWSVLSSGKNSTLKSLSLSSNRLNDQSMEDLANSMTKSSLLEKLVLTDNDITDSGGVHILRFAKENSSIKYVDITRTRLKRDARKMIKKTLKARRR